MMTATTSSTPPTSLSNILIQRRDNIDKKDELEQAWSEHFKKLQELISDKSDQEINNLLVNQVSNMDRYYDIILGLLFGILTDKSAVKYFQYLTFIVRDRYAFVVNRLKVLALEKYSKLTENSRQQLLWLVTKMVELDVKEADVLIAFLAKQIITGDHSPKNIWLIHQLLDILNNNKQWFYSQPALVPQMYYTFMSIINDHLRPQFDALREKEISFCLSLYREKFELLRGIGRDFIRLLQNVIRIPEFDQIWKEIIYDVHKDDRLSMVKQRTSRSLLQSRVTYDMENWLIFMMKQVKMGNQKRYQQWFATAFLSRPENETLIPDLIRFICGVYHPPNQILCSDVVPRWAVIGWLLKSIKTNSVLVSAKRALFYDWFFFDPKTDNIMNIEPAMLLMIHSIPKYVDITASLLEFLLAECDQFDAIRPGEVQKGIHNSLRTILEKGVVTSLEPLYSCPLLDSNLREAVKRLFAPFILEEQKPEISPALSSPSSPQPPPLLSDTLKNTVPPVIPTAKHEKIPTSKQTDGEPSDKQTRLSSSSMPSLVSQPSETVATRKSADVSKSSLLSGVSKSPTSKSQSAATLSATSVTSAVSSIMTTASESKDNDPLMEHWKVAIQRAAQNIASVGSPSSSGTLSSSIPPHTPSKRTLNEGTSNSVSSLRRSNEGKSLSVFGTMLTQLKTSLNNPTNAKNIMRKILNTYIQLCNHFSNDGNQKVKTMTIDLTAALLDIIHDEFKECKSEILFSPAHSEQNLHTMVFESYVEKRDKSILYLMKQMRKQETSIGFRFLCFLLEKSKLYENSIWPTLEEVLKDTDKTAYNSSEMRDALSSEQKDKENFAKIIEKWEQSKDLELSYSTRSKEITQTLRPYIELLELSASKNRTMQSLFDEDMKYCAESDPSLFLELASYLLKYMKDTRLIVEGNVSLIRSIVSTVYPSQLYWMSCKLFLMSFGLVGRMEVLGNVLKSSLEWSSFEQFCLWRLIDAEIAFDEEVRPIFIKFLQSLDPLKHTEALAGLQTFLVRQHPEFFLDDILQLPFAFSPFVAILLRHWFDWEDGRDHESYSSLKRTLKTIFGAKNKQTETQQNINAIQRILRHLTMYFILNPYDYEHTILADETISRKIKEVIVREGLQTEFNVLLNACEGEDTRWNDPYQNRNEVINTNKTKNLETNKNNSITSNNNKMWNKRNSEARNFDYINIPNKRAKWTTKEHSEQLEDAHRESKTTNNTKKRKRLNDDSEEPPSDSDGSDYDADGDDYLDSEEDDDILLMAGTKDRPATKRRKLEIKAQSKNTIRQTQRK
jgi:hypothetical protein